MRKLLLIIPVLLLFCYRVNAQKERYKDRIEIKTPVNINCEINAYEKITLKPGFRIGKGKKVKVSLLKKSKQGLVSDNKLAETKFIAIKPVKYVQDLGVTSDNAIISIDYYDNFGNIEQSHLLNATPDGRDIVSFNEFNPGSTTKRNLLSFAANTNGAYINNVQEVQRNFYNNPNDDVTDDAQPWSTVTVDNAPMQRVLTTTKVGADMAGHNKESGLSFNVADQVPEWRLDGDTWVFSGYYDQGTHIGIEIIDENGKQTTTVTNSMGQTVLTKSGNVENWYVYDYLGRLVHNIPSAAVQAIKAHGAGFRLEQTNNIVKEYVYTNKYVDGIPGIAEKFLPGVKGSVEYVYDRLDRIVLTRNIRLKNAGKWSFIKYDKYGRIIITGTFKTRGEQSRAVLQDIMLNDDTPLFEEVIVTAPPGSVEQEQLSYSNNAFPSKENYSNQVESIQVDIYNYYDRYWMPEMAFVAVEGFDHAQVKAKGRITGKKVRIDGGFTSGSYSKSALYYDDKGQLISTVSTSIFNKNILNRTYIKYDFVGRAKESLSLYNRKLKSGGFNEMEIRQYHAYDRTGRLLSVDQQINGDANGRVTMATYEYNAMGQMRTKNLHKKADGNFLQTVDYAYNIRGQLTDVNSVDDKNSNDVFAMHINYNKQLINSEVTATSLYNGFISSVEWRSGEGKKQAYAFEYDDNYRLRTAKYAAGDNLNEDVGRFNMSAEYDNMGNITRMQRNGGANGALIDDLTYNYVAEDGTKGNRLYSVTDASTNSFKDQYGFGKPEGKFWYDDLGNLIADSSREVYSIEYNDQNLPIRVVLFNGKEISYVYTAEGVKLTRVVYDPYTMKSIYTRYEGGFIYETDQSTNKLDLKYFAHPQGGRVVVNDNKFSYEYFISDHLGNVRATIGSDESGNLALLQTTDYYPFGLTMANGNKADADQPYQYGGKEWQNNTQVYDFHARQYNPVLGRWFNLDPLMEKYYGISPYNYCANNPMNYIDPDGMEWEDPDDGDRLVLAVTKRIVSLRATLEELKSEVRNEGDDMKAKRLEELKNKINDVRAMIEKLVIIGRFIVWMSYGTKHKFKLQQTKDGVKNGVRYSRGTIVIQGSSYDIFVHEIGHIYQSMKSDKGLVFSSYRWLEPVTESGLEDELFCYQLQFAFGEHELPEYTYDDKYFEEKNFKKIQKYSEINFEYIAHIASQEDGYIYDVIRKLWLEQNNK